MDKYLFEHMRRQMTPDEQTLSALYQKLGNEKKGANGLLRHKGCRPLRLALLVVLLFACLAAAMTATGLDNAMAKLLKNIFSPKSMTQQLEGEGYSVWMTPYAEKTVSGAGEGQSDGLAGYVIYVDEETFEKSTTVAGVTRIVARNNPDAYMEIEQMAGQTYEEAFGEEAALNVSSGRQDISDTNMPEACLAAAFCSGNKSQDKVTTVYAVDNGKGGCFLIRFVHTVEAEEGFGSRFKSMLSTFQITK